MNVDTPAMAIHLLVDPKNILASMGKFLRKSSLDDLPQLWSNIKDSMSFVGPEQSVHIDAVLS
jgi:O-antigen biosynthesis protein WbqP